MVVEEWKIKDPAYFQAEGRGDLFNLAGRAVPLAVIRQPHST
jgi:hypothetical protein